MLEQLTIGEVIKISEALNQAITTPQSQSGSMIGRFVIVRTYSAGVHIGTLQSINGTEVVLSQSRRIWSWSGAFTLSKVATEGIASGKLSCFVPEILLTQAIEVIPCSAAAKENLLAIQDHKP